MPSVIFLPNICLVFCLNTFCRKGTQCPMKNLNRNFKDCKCTEYPSSLWIPNFAIIMLESPMNFTRSWYLSPIPTFWLNHLLYDLDIGIFENVPHVNLVFNKVWEALPYSPSIEGLQSSNRSVWTLLYSCLLNCIPCLSIDLLLNLSLLKTGAWVSKNNADGLLHRKKSFTK